ncbi:MAG: hypothetical protein R2876_01570 [Eubacteriales bacterium]
MQNLNKKTYIFTAIVCIMLLTSSILLTSVIPLDTDSLSVFKTTQTATVSFTVVDGYSETPIPLAKVYIIETGKYYTTDEDGNTPEISVPVVLDDRFDSSITKPWGEINLIAYKDGYAPYALFYLEVTSATPRKNVKLLMFKEEELESGEPFSIIEGPNKLWVNKLIEKYAPQS